MLIVERVQLKLLVCIAQFLTLLSKYLSEDIASDFNNGVRSFGAVKLLFLPEYLQSQ